MDPTPALAAPLPGEPAACPGPESPGCSPVGTHSHPKGASAAESTRPTCHLGLRGMAGPSPLHPQGCGPGLHEKSVGKVRG